MSRTRPDYFGTSPNRTSATKWKGEKISGPQEVDSGGDDRMAVMGSLHLVYFKWQLWEATSVNVEIFIPITSINE